MHKGIATVSLSGVLTDKLAAIAAAGFDGVEIFDNDLISSPLAPREVAGRCAELGLTVDLFQPVRDIEGVAPEQFPRVLHRLRRKFEVMGELGTSTVLACSNVAPDTVDDADLRAEQLHRVGQLADEFGVTVAYEALAWGRHVNRVGQAWDAVRRAGHPAVTLAVDTFHMLARGDNGAALAGVPGDRIGFLQVADAPLLDMNVLEWSRHFRCFPGQGTLDVAGVVAAVLEVGYRGPLSLEVFSDVVREADPLTTARDAMRSLVFLEDQLAQRVSEAAREQVTVAPPPARRTDAAFVEVATPRGDTELPALLMDLGFHVAGTHRTKPVTWWRNGGASILVNEQAVEDPCATALGVVATPVARIADRARVLLWPEVDRTRGEDEALLPGITAPSGLHLFVSSAPGEPDDWHFDFEPTSAVEPPSAVEPVETNHVGWTGLDHVGVAVGRDQLNEELSFFRTLLGLVPGQLEEFMEPQGRLRSRALTPHRGDLRVVLNVIDRAPGSATPHGITQIAFATRNIVEEVRRLRDRGVEMMPVPENYYVDLDARFGLDPDLLDELRAHQLLYDRIGEGELLHAYTRTFEAGFHVELLERRGGYDGYGAANTHVRLAAQAAAYAREPALVH
jgi:4-hydroxyphenylpyruvate dioxygenase